MRKASDYLSKPLISLHGGRIEGIIKNISFDNKLKKAEWLVLYDENDAECDEKAVPFPEIYFVGENAIMVKNGQAVVPAVSAPLNDNNPINCRIYTAEGKHTGIVSDVILNEKDGVVELIYDKNKSLPLSEVFSSSRDIVVTATGGYRVKTQAAAKKVPLPKPADIGRKVTAENQPEERDTASGPKEPAAAKDNFVKRAPREKSPEKIKTAPAGDADAAKKTVKLRTGGQVSEVTAVKADNQDALAGQAFEDERLDFDAAAQQAKFEEQVKAEVDRAKDPAPVFPKLIINGAEVNLRPAAADAVSSEKQAENIDPPADTAGRTESRTKVTVKDAAPHESPAKTEADAEKRPDAETYADADADSGVRVWTSDAKIKRAKAVPDTGGDAGDKKKENLKAGNKAADNYKIYDNYSIRAPAESPAEPQYYQGGQPDENTGTAVPAAIKKKKADEAVRITKAAPNRLKGGAAEDWPQPPASEEAAGFIIVDSGEDIRIWPHQLEHIPERIIASYTFLLGRRVVKNIYNASRDIIIKADSVINAQIVETARKYGRLVDLTKLSR